MANGGNAQATWGGRFGTGPSELMLAFSESVSFDAVLARFDLEGSAAHARMLAHVGLITNDERDALLAGLAELDRRVAEGRMEWRIEFEDVHMNLEQALLALTPAAAKLHTARSRNDQVATDLRLWFRFACGDLRGRLHRALEAILARAEAVADVLVPGYTHLQRGQPVSLAHHLLAWAEMLGRDDERLAAVAERAGVCPLGSGALAGTTLPIDREFTAAALGFVDREGRPRVTRNSMDAVADRDVHLEFLSAAALAGIHLSRIAEDLVLWGAAEFGFARLPEALTTGSSLMPQKKNPDAAELLRGKSGRLVGNLQTLLVTCKGLPLTYNRDLQEDKPPLFDSHRELARCLDILAVGVAGLEVDRAACARAVADPLLLATDLADWLVLRGVPFRDAHHVVGALVRRAEEAGQPLPSLADEVVTAVHPALADPAWRGVFDLGRALAARSGTGMPGPAAVARELARWRERLDGAASS